MHGAGWGWGGGWGGGDVDVLGIDVLVKLQMQVVRRFAWCGDVDKFSHENFPGFDHANPCLGSSQLPSLFEKREVILWSFSEDKRQEDGFVLICR